MEFPHYLFERKKKKRVRDANITSTVYKPPEDGFKKRPKHVGASVKCF